MSFPPGRHRVSGIDREIEDREFELIGIGKRAPHVATENGFNRDLFAQRAPQQVGHTCDQAPEIDWFRIERLLTRESEQALCQRFRAARAAHRIVHGPFQPVNIEIGPAEVSLQRFEIADDDCQQIIEVVRDAACELADAFHLLRLPGALVCGAPFGEVARDLGKSEDLSVGRLDRIDDDACPKAASVLAHPPAFGLELSRFRGSPQSALWNLGRFVFRRVERRKMAADNLVAGIALGARRARIPVDDVTVRIKHEDRVIRDALDQKTEPALGIFKLGKACGQFARPLVRTLLETLIELLQLLLGPRSCRDFALAGLIKTRVVDRDGGLSRESRDNSFGALGKDARLRMAEEQPAEDFARPRSDRHGEIASHRKVAFGHAMIGRALSVSAIGKDVVRAHRPTAAERRFEDRGISRHRELFERLARRARKRVQRVGLAVFPNDVVEECTERGVAQFDARIGDHLNQLFEIVLGRDRSAGSVEHFKSARFLAHFRDARFQCFVEREQPRFERLAVGDVVEATAQQASGVRAVRRVGLCRPASARFCRDDGPEIRRKRRRFPSPPRLPHGSSAGRPERLTSPSRRAPAALASSPKSAAACGLHVQSPDSRSHSNVAIPAASPKRSCSSDAPGSRRS